MITGYNTDIRHRGVVFHVQTEDKGLSNPCVESLVYVGGQILTRRKSDYSRLVHDGADKEEIAALMEKQHRRMIAEIRSGALDAEVGDGLQEEEPSAVAKADDVAAESSGEESTRSLDQVILDYLSTEAEQEHLVLVMDSPDELQLGSEALLAFQAQSSVGRRPLPDAAIEVKLISTESEPVLLASGSTNEQGKLHLKIRLPELRRGTAALIIAASSEVGTAEIKHLI